MRIPVALALALALALVAGLHPSPCRAEVRETIDTSILWQTRNDAFSDNFYSIRPRQRDLSVSGYGYYEIGPMAYVATRHESKSTPHWNAWHRWFKGKPQMEHVFTHLADENKRLPGWGYVDEGSEGAVADTSHAGLTDLYRLAKFDGTTGDLQHVYTTDLDEAGGYAAQGWKVEGTKGYVFRHALPTAYPTLGVDATGAIYFTTPGLSDTSAASPQGKVACGGKLSVLLDGQAHGPFASDYLPIPGTTQYRCLSRGTVYAGAGAHTLSLRQSGFAARMAGTDRSGKAYDVWRLSPEATTVKTFTLGTGKAIGTGLTITDERFYADPRQVPEDLRPAAGEPGERAEPFRRR